MACVAPATVSAPKTTLQLDHCQNGSSSDAGTSQNGPAGMERRRHFNGKIQIWLRFEFQAVNNVMKNQLIDINSEPNENWKKNRQSEIHYIQFLYLNDVNEMSRKVPMVLTVQQWKVTRKAANQLKIGTKMQKHRTTSNPIIQLKSMNSQ